MALNPRTPAEWLTAEALPSDREFWRIWLREAGSVLGARTAMILHPQPDGEEAKPLMRWGASETPPADWQAGLSSECPLVMKEGERGLRWFAIRLPWDEKASEFLIVGGALPPELWDETTELAWRDRALLWATAASRRRRSRELETLRGRADELATAIELGGLLRGHETFEGAALELCNQLAARHGADRVALGWWREPYVRVCGISQHNQIETKMSAVGEIEAAMEEAVEQDATLMWPDFAIPDDMDEHADEMVAPLSEVLVQHAALARLQGWEGLCTIPLRCDGRIVGAVTWHRSDRIFTQDEAERFALVLDVLGPLMEERELRSGNWFRRLKRGAERALQRHANLTHPWPKLAAVSVALLLLASLLIHVPYRVEAEFQLRPQQQMVFSAPFDGYIHAVQVKPGDVAEAAEELFALEDTGLRLEEGEMLADLSRYNREREQAEAAHDLAKMRVATAQRDQVAARLARLQRQIEQSVVRAPFAGTVLDDGDLNERLGAPVRQGDSLLRFARLDGLYFELSVPEADAPLIQTAGKVEIAFSGRPDETVSAEVARMEPEAVAKEGGAFFLVRANPQGTQESWWRPGMTGIGKIPTEKRSLFDIFTRRLRDWLKLKLWW